MLGVKSHVLRDCRRRGELVGCKVGAKIVYTSEQLQAFLAKSRC
jgi:hypothetical protein